MKYASMVTSGVISRSMPPIATSTAPLRSPTQTAAVGARRHHPTVAAKAAAAIAASGVACPEDSTSATAIAASSTATVLSTACQPNVRLPAGMLNAVIASKIPAGDAADIRPEDEYRRPDGGLEITRAADDGRRPRCQAGHDLATKERTTTCGHG